MNREYHKWYSPRLKRDMELLIFGHAGAKVLVFPTRDGRFYEYENLRMINILRPKIEAGLLQFFCVDSLDHETFYNFWAHPSGRLHRHILFEEYILNEVMPLMATKNAHPCTIAHGCSLGAYHAASIAFRHPHLFQKLIAFSGRYDLTESVEHFSDLLQGYYSETLYYHTPTHFLPNLTNPTLLNKLRRMKMTFVIGKEDPFLENNKKLARILSQKKIPYAMHFWNGRAHSGYYWRRMIPLFF